MSSPHVLESLDAFFDEELDAAAHAAVAAHLSGCDACRSEFEARAALQRRLAAHAVPDPGAGYWADFTARVESRTRPQSDDARGWERLAGWLFPGGGFAWPRAVGALAACTLLVYVGLRGFGPDRVHVGVSPVPRAAPRAPAPERDLGARRDVAPAPTAPRATASAPPPQGGGRGTIAPPSGPPPAASELAARDAAGGPVASKARAKSTELNLPPTTRADEATHQGADKTQADAKSEPAPVAALERRETGAESTQQLQAPRTQTYASGPAKPAPVPAFGPVAGVSSLTQPSAGVAKDAPTLALQKPGATDAVSNSFPSEGAAIADPALPFLQAAIAGDATRVRAIAADPNLAPDLRAPVNRWLQLADASAPAAANPPGRAQLKASGSAVQAANDLDAWLLLDEVAWPRRTTPGMRDEVARVATGLLPHTDDERAVARARASLEWLATTSASDAERAAWQQRLDALPRQ